MSTYVLLDRAGLEVGRSENYDRLLTVKHRYDPDNLVHVNQNIR